MKQVNLCEPLNATPESAVAAVYRLMAGRCNADILSVAVELGLADQIKSDPKTAEEIAATMGLHAPSLYRLLRALAGLGILAEQKGGRFAHPKTTSEPAKYLAL